MYPCLAKSDTSHAHIWPQISVRNFKVALKKRYHVYLAEKLSNWKSKAGVYCQGQNNFQGDFLFFYKISDFYRIYTNFFESAVQNQKKQDTEKTK